MPPSGLAYLISYLRTQGFSSKIIDCSLQCNQQTNSEIEKMEEWLREQLILTNPRLAIGIGPCTTSAIRSIHATAKTCKKVYPNKPLIFGGPLALLPGMDWLFFGELGASAVVKGDGELPLASILHRMHEKKPIEGIQGVQTKVNRNTESYFLKNIDILPYPAWDAFTFQKYEPSIRRKLGASPTAPIIGSRGCPYSCSFCVSGCFIEYRRRSFEKIAAEIKVLQEKYGINSLIFYDDALFPNISTVNEELILLAELIEKAATNILWQIEIRPDVFSHISRDTVEFVFSRGCRQFNIGIEKISQSQLKLLKKPYPIERLKKACKMVTKVCPHMRLAGTFILGGPGEIIDSIHETVEFSTKLNLLFAHYSPLELYPGTPIYNQVFGKDLKVWYNKLMSDKYSWGEVIYENEDISADRLISEVGQAYHSFYEREEWIELAKFYFGEDFSEIHRTVKSWKRDRFQLSSSRR